MYFYKQLYLIMRHKLQLYPYRLQRLQQMYNFDSRLPFDKWMATNVDILYNILWTDKANFYANGHVNTHICVILGYKNPTNVLT